MRYLAPRVVRTLEELEKGLYPEWDRAQLAVYADALQSRNDPRGELIAIDLELERDPRVELEVRRRELLAKLLPDHPSITCRHGFVEISTPTDLDVIDAVLLGPFGAYVRALTVVGNVKQLCRVLMTVAFRKRRWLTALTLRQGGFGTVQLSHKVAIAVTAALPRLTKLDVLGSRMWPFAALPSLRDLTAAPYDAHAALVDLDRLVPPQHRTVACLPAVTTLTVVFDGGYAARPDVRRSRLLLPPSQLPAVRYLDLSRNTPTLDVFAFLPELPILPQLEYLRLPPVTDTRQAEILQSILDRMPRLAELEVVDVFRPINRVPTHPTARLVLPGVRPRWR